MARRQAKGLTRAPSGVVAAAAAATTAARRMRQGRQGLSRQQATAADDDDHAAPQAAPRASSQLAATHLERSAQCRPSHPGWTPAAQGARSQPPSEVAVSVAPSTV